MKIILKALSCICLMLFLATVSQAKGRRGIIPLHSTRVDVEQILGRASDNCKCTYYSEDVNVFVVYSSGNCKKGSSGNWNIPPNTVIRFTVYPKIHPKLSDLNIDESKFTKEEDPELPGIFYYFNRDEGFGMTVEDGIVRDFFYEPAAIDNNLRCPGSRS